MLRVRLDCCVERGDLTIFEGEPLSGVGVDVADDVLSLQHRAVGTVKLWTYQDGRRVAPWLPPFASGGDVLVDEAGTNYGGESDDRILIAGQPLNGAELAFGGPFLLGVQHYVDGFAVEGTSTHWHSDGSLASLSAASYVHTEGLSFKITQDYAWSAGVTVEPNEIPEVLARVRVAAGEMIVMQDGAPRFSAFPPLHPQSHHSFLRVGRDAAGRLGQLEMLNPSHFDLLRELAVDIEPLDWLPLSWTDVTSHEIGDSLVFAMPDVEAQRTIAAFGGMARFSQVKRLDIRAGQLAPQTLAQFLALSALSEVVVHGSRIDDEVANRIRDALVDVRASRPALVAILDGKRI